jgi:hypothetical protein
VPHPDRLPPVWHASGPDRRRVRARPDADHLFLKPASPPAYLTCGTSCTTIQYKSLTREHIASLGFPILADVGDQFSDLKGGFSGRTVKMPNPMYFIP